MGLTLLFNRADDKELYSSDVGVGADAITEQLSTRSESDTGAGADVILESLSSRLESETGTGVDALIGLLKVIAKFGSDTGSGADAISEQLVAVLSSEEPGYNGSGNLAGPGGVTVTHNLGITNYQPEIEITEESGAVGEIWITDVGTNSFVVRNSGAGKDTFDWAIYDGSIAADHRGIDNLAGPGGVTVTHNLGITNYQPEIEITEESGAVGEIWITDVGTNSFVVRNSGAGLAEFSWIICEEDVAADHRGIDNLAGPGGVTVTHNLDLAFYQSQINVTVESGAVGEIWITDVGTNSFVVRNSGAGLAEFSWIIYDVVSGIDAISSRLFDSSDVGVGVDNVSELLATLSGSDEGIGVDVLSTLLAELKQADSGTGVETTTVVIWIYLLLKLLQKKGLDIDLSQKGRGLNLKISQEGSPK